MPPAVPIRLAAAALVEISGRDAGAFAQAQFGSDVSTLAAGTWQWSAWLDAQGRVRNVFALLMAEPQRLLAWLPLGDAEAMAVELSRYVLRSKVDARALADWHVLLATAPAPPPGQLDVAGRPGSFGLAAAPGGHVVLSPDATNTVDDDGRAYTALRLAAIDAGLPWLARELAGEFVAAALDLGRIGATSLGKGCYPGQEIVARLHYRGGNKRQLRRLMFAAAELHDAGERVLAPSGDTAMPCGRLLYAATATDGMGHALAVIDDGREADAGLALASGAAIVRVEGIPNLAR